MTFAAVKLCIAFPYFALIVGSRRQGTIGKQSREDQVTDKFRPPFSLFHAYS